MFFFFVLNTRSVQTTADFPTTNFKAVLFIFELVYKSIVS